MRCLKKPEIYEEQLEQAHSDTLTLSWNKLICCLQITPLLHLTFHIDSRRRQEDLRAGCRLRSCFASFCNKHTMDDVPAFQNRKTYVELHLLQVMNLEQLARRALAC